VVTVEEWGGGEEEEGPECGASAENLAYVIYTSGSSGRPKGVMVRQRSVVNFLNSMNRELEMSEEDIVLAITTLSFDIAGLELLLPLVAGGRVVIADRESGYDGRLLGEELERSGATMMQATPASWRLVREAGWLKKKRLKKILCGGEALSEELGRELEQSAEQAWNLYGPTETTIWSTEQKLGSGRGVRIGRAIANTQVYVVERCGQLAPLGVVGELWIGGEGVARGYVGRAEMTAEKFVPDGFSGGWGERLYRTGDLVRWSGGELEYVGRMDGQVKVRGFRIELGEIEEVLNGHAGVREAVVTVGEDKRGEKRLVAYVVEREAGTAEGKQLREYLGSKLPEYMVPNAYVKLTGMPLTSSGKIDRQALAAAGKEDERMAGEGQEEEEGPRTILEEILTGIWEEVLGVPRVGLSDNFFDLGGHSLLAMQLLMRVRQAMQVDAPLRTIFENSTLRKFSEAVGEMKRRGAGLIVPAIVAVERKVEIPLSYAQRRLWFFDQLAPGSGAYNVPLAVRIRGTLNIAILRRTLDEILARHEMLRTVLAAEKAGSPPRQIIRDGWPGVALIDLTGLEQNCRAKAAMSMAKTEAHRGFHLAQGPLFRATVLRLDRKEYVLLLTMHHVVSDDWSVRILLREITAIYRSFLKGEPSPLKPLAVQYSDYAIWQHDWLQSKSLGTHMAYWKRQLAEVNALALPTDNHRPAAQSFRGGRKSTWISKELTDSLVALSRREGATLFMTLLAAFQALLARCCHQADICVGTDVDGRTQIELEQVVGCFVNQLVLRIILDDDPTFCAILSRARSVALDAHAHAAIPFDYLVNELRVKRDASRHPLFQVKFLFRKMDLELLELESKTAEVDLSLSITEADGQLLAQLDYCSDLLAPETAARVLTSYLALLQNVVRNPECKLSALELSPVAPHQVAAEVLRNHLRTAKPGAVRFQSVTR
jgi:amino acid adenylation domain-containing protein